MSQIKYCFNIGAETPIRLIKFLVFIKKSFAIRQIYIRGAFTAEPDPDGDEAYELLPGQEQEMRTDYKDAAALLFGDD